MPLQLQGSARRTQVRGKSAGQSRRHDCCAVMKRMSKLSTQLMALVLGLAGFSGVYAQSSGSQSQSPSEQEPTQPAQPEQPTKSPDDNSDKTNQDQLPTPPVVAGTSNHNPANGAFPPVHRTCSS